MWEDYIASLPTILKYGYTLEGGIKVWLNYHSAKTINDVLWLYYGAWCIIAHGVAELIIVEGCLHNFPSNEDLASGMTRRAVAEKLRGLYERLQQDQREAVIKYCELLMMCRFFRSLANRLMVSVAIVVQDMSDKQPILWGCKKEIVLSRANFSVQNAPTGNSGKAHNYLPPLPSPSYDNQNPLPLNVGDQDPANSAGTR